MVYQHGDNFVGANCIYEEKCLKNNNLSCINSQFHQERPLKRLNNGCVSAPGASRHIGGNVRYTYVALDQDDILRIPWNSLSLSSKSIKSLGNQTIPGCQSDSWKGKLIVLLTKWAERTALMESGIKIQHYLLAWNGPEDLRRQLVNINVLTPSFPSKFAQSLRR